MHIILWLSNWCLQSSWATARVEVVSQVLTKGWEAWLESGGGGGVTLQKGKGGLGKNFYGFTGSLVADIQHKPHRKHLPNCTSTCIHLPLILVKPGPSQGQIPPFEPVTALRKDVWFGTFYQSLVTYHVLWFIVGMKKVMGGIHKTNSPKISHNFLRWWWGSIG